MVGRLSLAAGLCHVVWYSTLPPSSWIVALIGVLAVLRWRLGARWRALAPHWRLGARALCLFALGTWAGALRLDTLAARQWPAALDQQRVPLVYEVVSIPLHGSRGVSFTAEVLRADCAQPACASLRGQRIALRWHQPEVAPQAGDRYQGKVALRRPRSTVNPGTSDGRAYLLARGIVANGSAKGEQRWLERSVNRAVLREALAQRALAGLPAERHWRALLIGDRGLLTDADYVILNRTGTAHLFAISGLHVGLVAAWCGGLGLGLARLLAAAGGAYRVTRWLPLATALTGAAVYSALADFAVSTERALAAVAVVIIARGAGARAAPGTLLATTFVVVAALEPLAWLQPGFWLSFGAVALLVYGLMERGRGLATQLLGAQGVLAVGMVAPSLALGIGVSAAGFAVNAVVVPLFSLVVVPGLMLGTALAALDPGWDWLLTWLDTAFLWLWDALAWAAQAPLWWPARPLTPAVLLGLGVGAVLLLAPRGIGLKPLGAILLAAAIGGRPPPEFALKLTVLDVGQGLSLVLETPERAYVYDTGPRTERFDPGRRIVTPYLRSRGLHEIHLVVSHADNDHAGGAQSLVEELRAPTRLGGEPLPDFEPCRRGMELHPEGAALDVTVLWPVPARGADWPAETGNNASCVLLLSLALPERTAHILLTGDIDRGVERRLLGDLPPLDLLIAPHHGSASSSSWPLLRRTEPRYVVFSAGYANSYGHPAAKVINRYDAIGSTMLSTAQHGALTFTWSRVGELSVTRARDQHVRSWH